jgi:hypothetical protein
MTLFPLHAAMDLASIAAIGRESMESLPQRKESLGQPAASLSFAMTASGWY